MQIWNGCNALNIAGNPIKDISVNLSLLSLLPDNYNFKCRSSKRWSIMRFCMTLHCVPDVTSSWNTFDFVSHALFTKKSWSWQDRTAFSDADDFPPPVESASDSDFIHCISDNTPIMDAEEVLDSFIHFCIASSGMDVPFPMNTPPHGGSPLYELLPPSPSWWYFIM